MLAAYLVLTLVVTYPLVTQLTTAVPGDGSDSWFHYWNLWWVRRAITTLHTNPYFSTEVHHPDGASLLFHSLILAPALLVLPITVLLGITLAYNSVVVASFVGSAYGAYRLFLEVVPEDRENARDRHRAAFLCGAFFAFSAYRLIRLLGHLDLLSTPCIPVYVLFLSRAWRLPGRKNVIAASACLALAPLCAWYYWLYMLFFTAALSVAYGISERGRPTLLASELRMAAVLVLGTLWIAPLLVPMLRSGATAGALAEPAEETISTSADLVSFVFPSIIQSLWGPALWNLWLHLFRESNQTESVVYLGFVPLLLACFARGSGRRFWAFVLAASCLLALGPVLHVAGATIAIRGQPIRLPYHYLLESWFPFAAVLRAPSRFVVIATLALAVLAGMGALRVSSGRLDARVVCASALVLYLLENAVAPYPSSAVSYSPIYDLLRSDPGHAAVLEVPIPDDPAKFPRRMLYQTVHEKPVFGGYLSRGLPTFPLARIPGLAPWKTLPADPARVLGEDVVAGMSAQDVALATLAFYDTGYVVVDKSLLAEDAIARARSLAAASFGGTVHHYEDAEVLAYQAPPLSSLGRPMLVLADGWYDLEAAGADAPLGAPARWRWMGESARFAVVAPRPGRCRIYVHAWSFDRERRVAVSLDGEPIAEWQITPILGEHRVEGVSLSAGKHVLGLRSVDGAERVSGRLLSVAVYGVGLEPDLAPAEPARLQSSARRQ